MENKAKRGWISSRQLLFILFTVRLYSLLIDINSLADFALSFALSVILCVAAARITVPKIIAGVLALILTFQTVLTYLNFTKSAVHPEFSQPLLIVLICASVIYAASLKIEALSRFSAFSAAVIVLALLIAVLTNLNAFNINYLNALSFEVKDTAYNYFKCIDLPVVYAIVSPRVNKNAQSALFKSIAYSYSLSLVILLFCVCIMGTAADIYPCPAFTLFQLARVGSLSRLDILFTGSALLAMFLKCSVLLYCGIYGLTGGKYEKV